MKRANVGAIARGVLGIVGLGIVVQLIRSAGPARVLSVVQDAGAYLPLIALLEVGQITSDFVALRLILGSESRKVAGRTWLRTCALSYACMILVPAGRAAGEVTRATILSTTLGAARAATASTQLQAAYLSANGFLSLVECSVVATLFGVRSPLALLLAGNVVFQGVVSTGLLAILWDARIGHTLDRWRRRLVPGAVESAPLDPAVRRRLPYKPFAACCVSRLLQLLQYGVILVAVGGVFSLRGAMITHGIHLVGATLGDLVPSQLGVVDGLYRAFAGEMGFAHAPARALSIAFVVRIAQITLAGVCVLIAMWLRPAPRAAEAAPPTEREEGHLSPALRPNRGNSSRPAGR